MATIRPSGAAIEPLLRSQNLFLFFASNKVELVDEGEGTFYRTVYYVKKFDDIGCFDIALGVVASEPLQFHLPSRYSTSPFSLIFQIE